LSVPTVSVLKILDGVQIADGQQLVVERRRGFPITDVGAHIRGDGRAGQRLVVAWEKRGKIVGDEMVEQPPGVLAAAPVGLLSGCGSPRPVPTCRLGCEASSVAPYSSARDMPSTTWVIGPVSTTAQQHRQRRRRQQPTPRGRL
jgi:hypothetical protein